MSDNSSHGAPRRFRRGSSRALAGAGVGVLAVVLAACGSSSTKPSGSAPSGTTGTSKGGSSASTSGLYGTLPAVGGTPTGSGTITVGQLKGTTPVYIMPITPAADASVYTTYDFINLYNQPLYWGPKGAVPTYDTSLSLANLPTYSNGNKTVTITIKPWKWSNGQTVTAQDVLLYIDVLKAAVKASAANFSNYTPGYFPDNVASATASGQTLTLNLTKAYNPGYFTLDQLDLLYAFPQAWATDGTTTYSPTQYSSPATATLIYNYLNKQASTLSTFGTNPLWKISDGPMKVNTFNATSGEYTMVPNTSYGGPVHAHFTQLDAPVFTTVQAEFNQMLTGNLDIGGVDYSDLPQVPALRAKGYSVYGLPDFGFEAAFINFQDTTGHFNSIASQLYFRQALAHLVDQAGYIRGIFKGAGGPGYGPVPAVPSSPYTPSNATNAPYPYSISAASKLLSSNGWKVVPNGLTTCVKPGTAAGDCGAGIPAGTPLSFNWQYGNTPPAIGQQSVAFASAAKQVGLELTLQQKTFNYLISNDSDPSAPSKKNQWAFVDFGGFTQSEYPTTNTLFNTGGSFNLGGYNSPQANTLINNSVYGANPNAVKSEASYLAQNIPVLFQPNPDLIIAVKNTIGSSSPNAWLNMTQYTQTPQYWFVK